MHDSHLVEINHLVNAVSKAWSLQSSSKWSEENPAKGQCGVTTLVVHDFFGDDIMKTWLSDGWHFYNVINGKRYDLTNSQFHEPITYMDVPSTREEAFSDTTERQYTHLKNSVIKQIMT
jgi:hypothetical protein